MNVHVDLNFLLDFPVNMAEFNSILPPDFALRRGEAYKCYLENTQISPNTIIKNLLFSSDTNTPFKDLNAIEHNESLSESLSTAISIASTELTKYIKYVNERCIKNRRAIKDRRVIFSLSDYPLLRKDWNGVLLKQPLEENSPQYLKIFSDGQQDADLADVKMMSSDGVTFLLNRLFLASASMMFRKIFSDILPTLDDGAEILIQTNIHSDELKSAVQFIMFGQIDCDEKCPNDCRTELVLSY